MNTTLKRSIRLSIAALLAVPFVASAATSSGDNYISNAKQVNNTKQDMDQNLYNAVNVNDTLKAMTNYKNMIHIAGTKTYFGVRGAMKGEIEYSTRGVANPDNGVNFNNKIGNTKAEKDAAGYNTGGKLDGRMDGSFIAFNTRSDLANGENIKSSIAIGIGTRDYGNYTDHGWLSWFVPVISGATVTYGGLMAGLSMSNFVDPYSMSMTYIAGGGNSYVRRPQVRYTMPLGAVKFSISMEKAKTHFSGANGYSEFDYIPDLTARLSYGFGSGNNFSLSAAVVQNRVAKGGGWNTGSSGDILNGKIGYAGNLGLRIKTMGADFLTLNLAGQKGAKKYLGGRYTGYDGFVKGQGSNSQMTLDAGYSYDIGYVHFWSKKMFTGLSIGGQSVRPSKDLGSTNSQAGLDKTTMLAAINMTYKLNSKLSFAGQYSYMRAATFDNIKLNNQLLGVYATLTF